MLIAKSCILFALNEGNDRQVDRPAYSGIGGVKGHDIKEISFPEWTALYAGSFTIPRRLEFLSVMTPIQKGGYLKP
jgi:hypothetical protein